MRRLPLLTLLLAIPASAQVPPDVFCADRRASCNDLCSLELGTRAETRVKLPECLERCEQGEIVCLTRFIARARKPAQERALASEGEEDPDGRARAAGEDDPGAQSEAAPLRRRSSTSSTELQPHTEPAPAAYPESTDPRYRVRSPEED